MTERARVVLEPGNPHDFTQQELEELRSELAVASPGIDVEIAIRPERGYGVTLEEVLYVWDLATDVVGDLTTVGGPLAIIVRWIQKRFQRDREQHPEATPRPRSVNLLGPDGRPIKRIVVRDPDDGPFEDSIDDAAGSPPRHRPDAGH